MTENKAIEYLNHMLQMMGDEPPENIKNERDIKEWEDEHKKIRETLEISKDALEEIQQYRAIGTVEKLSKLKELYDKAKWLLDDERKKRRSYEAIGTIDEFKALKEKNEPKKLLAKWDMYPTNHGIYSASDRWCPNCKTLVFDGDWDNCRQRIMYGKYICSCGQKLDWSK